MTKATLTGSEKQIAWAEDIREEFEDYSEQGFDRYIKVLGLDKNDELRETVKILSSKISQSIIENETSSKVYIDNRDCFGFFIIERAFDNLEDNVDGVSEKFIETLNRVKEGTFGRPAKVKAIELDGLHFIIVFPDIYCFRIYADEPSKRGTRLRSATSDEEIKIFKKTFENA